MTDNPSTKAFDIPAPTEAIEMPPVIQFPPREEERVEFIADLLVLNKPYGTTRWLVVGIMSEDELRDRLLPGDPGWDYGVVRLGKEPDIMIPSLGQGVEVRYTSAGTVHIPSDILSIQYNSPTYELAAAAAFDLFARLGVATDDSARRLVDPNGHVGDMIQTLVMFGYEKAVSDMYFGKTSMHAAVTDMRVS